MSDLLTMMKMSTTPPPPPKWVLDINSPPISKPKAASIPDPPGFIATTSGNKVSFPRGSINFDEVNLTDVVSEASRCIKADAKGPNYRRDRYLEAQEGLGSRPRADKTTSHDGDHDVHVREWTTNLQYHDGCDGIQEPDRWIDCYKLFLYTVRV